MNNDRLQEIGGQLGVTRAEIVVMKKQRLGEDILQAPLRMWAFVIGILAGIQGFSVAGYYLYMDGSSSYPGGTYDPPGGWFMPMFAFTGLAGLTGGAGLITVKLRKGPNMNANRAFVMVATLLSILAFNAVYFLFGPLLVNWTRGFMYGVYSREEVKPLG